MEENGRIDVLVLNAGTPSNAMFNDLDEVEEKRLREVCECVSVSVSVSVFVCVFVCENIPMSE